MEKSKTKETNFQRDLQEELHLERNGIHSKATSPLKNILHNQCPSPNLMSSPIKKIPNTRTSIKI